MIVAISGKAGSGKDTVGNIIQYLTSNYYIMGKTFEEFNEINTRRNDYPLYLNWQIKKFAGKLKEIVSILTSIPVEDLEKQEVKDRVLGKEWWYYTNNLFYENKKNIPFSTASNKVKNNVSWYIIKPTVRQLLQEIGTEAMRNIIHPNIWVNALFNEYIPKETGRKDSLVYPNWIITDLRFPNELQRVKDYRGIAIKVTRNNLPNNSSNHCSEVALDYVKEWDYIINNNTNNIKDLIKKVREILINEKIM